MILADTSVWVDHFRRPNARLQQLLQAQQILTHSFIIGELACGNLPKRPQTLHDLGLLPQAIAAREDEVRSLVEERRLWGRGIGWIDAHLLASAFLSGCGLWTFDQRLNEVACSLAISL